MKQNRSSIASDILGALAGTAVILPQSMGLGVALFLVMGLDASSGALAGIIGAAVLSLISGIFGATLGMFSAPNGPVTMLLIGVFTTMAAAGVSGESMLTTLSAILILTGLFQIIFALFGGAKLVKYIPYPVIVALITGVGILMIKSQLKIFFTSYTTIEDVVTASIPLLVAIITIVTIIFTPKITKKVPAPLMGLFSGLFIYQLINYFYLHNAYSSWVVGEIPSVDSLHFGISLNALKELDFELVITSSLALTILATTDCLVTALVADAQTNTRHNGKKEIIAQGIGQIIIGFLGGLGGGGTKGATLVNLQSGGGRYSSIFSGIFFILLMLFFGFLGVYLPIAVLAGVIMYVGYGMINFDIISWFIYSKSRVDAFIALLVIATIVFVNLVTAVGVGILISILMYIRMQMKSPIVHRKIDGTLRRSLVKRTETEEQVLDEYGKNIVMFELRGNLFFATADKLLETLDAYIKKDYFVILHFQRVQLLDITGVILLLQVASNLKNAGGELLLCHMHKELGLGKKINKALENIDKKHNIKIKTFVNTDDAFLYAENKTLQLHNIELRERTDFIAVEKNNFCRNLPQESLQMIERLSTKVEIKDDEVLFEQGDFGSSLFMVLQGEVDIRLYTDSKDYTTLARYGAGTYFGEISFLNPGKRVATAIANYDTILLEFTKEDVLQLALEEKAQLATALLFELGKTLGDELRHSAQEIKRLEET